MMKPNLLGLGKQHTELVGELELTQAHMAQKQMLRVKWGRVDLRKRQALR